MTRVITGDCREVLPTIEHADVVITDPVWPLCPKSTWPPRIDTN